MGVPLNLKAQKFHRLTAMKPVRLPTGTYGWECECDCGNIVAVRTAQLRNGMTKSCGCWKTEATLKSRTVHGHNSRSHGPSPTYRSWIGMRSRCLYPAQGNDNYSTVCDEWKSDFATFLRDMGERPSSGHSIDRIDNSRGYEPANCRWATRKEQMRNKTDNRFIDSPWGTITIAEAAERAGIKYATLYNRILRHKPQSTWFKQPQSAQLA